MKPQFTRRRNSYWPSGASGEDGDAGVPVLAMSAAGGGRYRLGVGLTSVVARLPSFQRTVEAGTNPLPVTVSVKGRPTLRGAARGKGREQRHGNDGADREG